jgi:hypothetical protein
VLPANLDSQGIVSYYSCESQEGLVRVPAEFPESRLQWLKADGLWAVVFAAIFAILAGIAIAKLM